MPKVNGTKIFMADTMAGGSGGIVGPLKKVLMTKGYDCIGAKEFIMPSSMASKVDNNKDEKIKKSETLAKEYAIDLLNGKTSWNRIPGASDVMRSMSKPKAIWTKMASTLKVDNNICIKCGLCVEVCPVGSISMDVNGFPKNDKRCNSCLRCLSYCPVNAYEFTGKKIVQNKTVDIKQLID